MDAVGEGAVVAVHAMGDELFVWVEVVQDGVGVVLLAGCPDADLGDFGELVQEVVALRADVDAGLDGLAVHVYEHFDLGLRGGEHAVY